MINAACRRSFTVSHTDNRRRSTDSSHGVAWHHASAASVTHDVIAIDDLVLMLQTLKSMCTLQTVCCVQCFYHHVGLTVTDDTANRIQPPTQPQLVRDSSKMSAWRRHNMRQSELSPEFPIINDKQLDWHVLIVRLPATIMSKKLL